MIKIERAKAADAKEIAQLNKFVQKFHVATRPDIFKPASNDAEVEQFFEKLLNNEDNYFYMAYIAEVSVGYIWAEIYHFAENPLKYARSRTYIHHVCVDEGYRKKGVGLALMREVEKLSKEAEIKTIALDTWSFNREAQKFFKHQGFEIFNLRMWKELQ